MKVMSEQASEKVVLADHLPGASTYPGTRTRGGWVPILLKLDDYDRPRIIDWICPTCHRLTAKSRCCPSCGLEVLEVPRIKPKEPLQRGMKIYQYRKWADTLFGENNNENDKPRSKAHKQKCPKLSTSER